MSDVQPVLDQIVHFFARSTLASTGKCGCQLTAVIEELRIKKPPDLGVRRGFDFLNKKEISSNKKQDINEQKGSKN